jgi:hypothetical protein
MAKQAKDMDIGSGSSSALSAPTYLSNCPVLGLPLQVSSSVSSSEGAAGAAGGVGMGELLEKTLGRLMGI